MLAVIRHLKLWNSTIGCVALAGVEVGRSIGSSTTAEGVGATAASQRVVAVAAAQDIVVVAAVEEIIAISAIDDVVAVATADCIHTVPAAEQIVAGVPVDRVLPLQAEDHIYTGCPVERLALVDGDLHSDDDRNRDCPIAQVEGEYRGAALLSRRRDGDGPIVPAATEHDGAVRYQGRVAVRGERQAQGIVVSIGQCEIDCAA